MPSSSLADVIDSLLGKGTVLLGETSISLAGVDLVYLQVQLMLSSTANLVGKRHAPAPAIRDLHMGGHASPRDADASRYTDVYDDAPAPAGRGVLLAEAPARPSEGVSHGSVEPESPEKGLARLALTVVELLRQTVERQAVRRVDAGGLTDDEVERMGLALLELEQKMAQLRGMFGLTEEETNVDLGPIGQVL